MTRCIAADASLSPFSLISPDPMLSEITWACFRSMSWASAVEVLTSTTADRIAMFHNNLRGDASRDEGVRRRVEPVRRIEAPPKGDALASSGSR